MKVKDLIVKLQAMPQDSEVLVGEQDWDGSFAYPLEDNCVRFEDEWENEDGSEFKDVSIIFFNVPDSEY